MYQLAAASTLIVALEPHRSFNRTLANEDTRPQLTQLAAVPVALTSPFPSLAISVFLSPLFWSFLQCIAKKGFQHPSCAHVAEVPCHRNRPTIFSKRAVSRHHAQAELEKGKSNCTSNFGSMCS